MDIYELNDLLTSVLARKGWTAETDEDDERLNDLTHEVAELIEGFSS